MRKSGFIFKGLIFLILSLQTHTAFSQEFGHLPFHQCWKKGVENTGNVVIASDNAKEFVSSNVEGLIELADLHSGKSYWQSEIGTDIYQNFILDKDRVFFISRPPGFQDSDEIGDNLPEGFTINSLSRLTGLTDWQRFLPADAGKNAYLNYFNKHLTILTDTGKIFFLNKETGEVLLENNIPYKPVSIPFNLQDKLLFGTDDNKLVVLSTQDGNIVGERQLKIKPNIIYGTDLHNLFISDKTGNILSVNEEGKTNWEVKVGAEITNITKAAKGLLVSSLDNYVYLLSEKNGNRIWRKRLAGRSTGKPLIKDNVAAFSTLNGNDAVFIDLKKGNTVNRIAVDNDNYFTGNPVDGGDLIIFQTFQGLIAYGNEKECNKQ